MHLDRDSVLRQLRRGNAHPQLLDLLRHRVHRLRRRCDVRCRATAVLSDVAQEPEVCVGCAHAPAVTAEDRPELAEEGVARGGDRDVLARAELVQHAEALVELLEGLDLEEDWRSGLEDDEELSDNLEGDVDVRAGLSADDLRELETTLLPVKKVLAKVNQCLSVM